jgi:hypothetical protein
VTCGALIATGAFAQVEVTVPEAGRVKTTAKVENGILGVTNSFVSAKLRPFRSCSSTA